MNRWAFLEPIKAQARAIWQRLASREKTMVTLAGALIAVALLWWMALAPALQTLRTSAAEQARLQNQIQQMQRLQAQALALQSQPKPSRDDAIRALQSAVAQWLKASGQLNLSGDQASLMLKGAAPEALAQWLVQARVNAHVVPSEARLTRSDAGWNGTLALGLP